MDLTSSINATVQEESESKEDNENDVTTSHNDVTTAHNDVTNENDDSPENSPELLPINSVSYHQVSPVIISSSEMEKRANQKLEDENSPTEGNSPTEEKSEPVLTEQTEEIEEASEQLTANE